MIDKFFTDSQYRIDIIEAADFSSVTPQLIGYLKFLESFSDVKEILKTLLDNKSVEAAIQQSSNQSAPTIKTLEEVASACVFLLEMIREKNDSTVLFALGIRGYHGGEFAAIPHEFTRRYLRPFHAYLIFALTRCTQLEELHCRLTTLLAPQFQESSFRVAGVWEWLTGIQTLKTIIDETIAGSRADKILTEANYNSPPQTESPEEIIAVGLLLMQECASGGEIYKMEHKYGIRSNFSSTRIQDTCDAVMNKFIMPAIYFVAKQLEDSSDTYDLKTDQSVVNGEQLIPVEIRESIERFRKDHAEPTAFIMMQFSDKPAHNAIVSAIKATLKTVGITALRADDHQYHDDVLPNVKTYMHGCAFGIAVFERIEGDVFNPNVSLEVGYMMAIGKSICYLKDKSLNRLQTDLISKLYREFDTYAIEKTLPVSLNKWLHEKGIC